MMSTESENTLQRGDVESVEAVLVRATARSNEFRRKRDQKRRRAAQWSRVMGRFRDEIFMEVHRGFLTVAEFSAMCVQFGASWELTIWEPMGLLPYTAWRPWIRQRDYTDRRGPRKKPAKLERAESAPAEAGEIFNAEGAEAQPGS